MRLDALQQQADQWATAEKFPFYKTEPVPEELVEKVNLKEWPYCEVDSMVLAAADRIEACLKCGNYTLAHEGACNGCRWREMHHET